MSNILGSHGFFESWQNRNIIIITKDTEVLTDEIKARVKRRSWDIALITSDVKRAFDSIKELKVSMLIFDSSPDLPASVLLRAQLNDPLAFATPTLVLCDEHTPEKNYFKEIGVPELVDKPLNPTKFIDGLEWLLRKWSTGEFVKLRAARNLFLENNSLEGAKQLGTLINKVDIIPIVIPSFCYFLKDSAENTVIEKMLLGAVKAYPRNLGIIFSTVDFYIRMAMPAMAKKLLEAIKKHHGNIMIAYPDQIQAYILMNDLGSCIPLLEAMYTSNFMPAFARSTLAKCYLAEGMTKKFKMLYIDQPLVSTQFQEEWGLTE
jgi:hypothetical protein